MAKGEALPPLPPLITRHCTALSDHYQIYLAYVALINNPSIHEATACNLPKSNRRCTRNLTNSHDACLLCELGFKNIRSETTRLWRLTGKTFHWTRIISNSLGKGNMVNTRVQYCVADFTGWNSATFRCATFINGNLSVAFGKKFQRPNQE